MVSISFQKIVPARRRCSARFRGTHTRFFRSPTLSSMSAAPPDSSTRTRTSTSSLQLVLGNPVLASLYAHEIFHAWNVKRLRPAEMWPYGTTASSRRRFMDQRRDHRLLRRSRRGARRGHNAEQFYATTTGKIDEVAERSAGFARGCVAHHMGKPLDGTEDIYYPKGSLAGLLLDIMIRDASDNQRSLDTVMREMYQTISRKVVDLRTTSGGLRFRARQAGGRSLNFIATTWTDGAAFPYDSVLPLAGLRLMVDRTVLPNLGISSSLDDQGRRVIGVDPAGNGGAAGVKVGDYLVSVGGLDVGELISVPRSTRSTLQCRRAGRFL